VESLRGPSTEEVPFAEGQFLLNMPYLASRDVDSALTLTAEIPSESRYPLCSG
jgi:hypothetical protein